MSSTTSPERERGQSLVIFALSLVVLFGFAALAFDVGQMLLDRRAEQNAADAAALAGARYVVEPTCFASPSLAHCANAVNEALRVARINGYGDGSSNGVAAADGTTIKVQVPPGTESAFAGQSGYVEVQISRSRGSLFAGVLGIAGQHVGVLANAANRSGVAADYSMIVLNKTACPSAKFTGSGVVSVSGNIQVDSACRHNPDAFDAGGATTVTVTSPNGAINVVGTANWPSGNVNPAPSTGQAYVPDPLAFLPAPALPALPADVVQLAGPAQAAPSGCPGGGSGHATALAPATCSFESSYANGGGTTWLLSPGYYPGGISVQGGTLFLKPGVYYIGGGGFNAAGTGAYVYSVSSTWSGSTQPTSCTATSFADCGGVLIYNTNDPTATSGGSPVKDMRPISLNGSESIVHLYGIQNAGIYTNIVIFQDPSLPSSSSSGDVQLNGNGANLYVQGTIYVPKGYVAVQGTGNLGPTQFIADTFSATGSSTLTIDYNQDLVAQFIAVGLVE